VKKKVLKIKWLGVDVDKKGNLYQQDKYLIFLNKFFF